MLIRRKKPARVTENGINNCEKSFMNFWEPNRPACVLLTKSCKTGQSLQHESRDYLEDFMDAKWNKVIDNTMVRIAMVVVGFGAWFAIGYGLMSL
jgi:hypothetical protein